LLPEGGVLRQQINHAAQALERCQGIESQRPPVCLGPRQAPGADQARDMTQVPAPSPHRPKDRPKTLLVHCAGLAGEALQDDLILDIVSCLLDSSWRMRSRSGQNFIA
jgi:hypothetical protein